MRWARLEFVALLPRSPWRACYGLENEPKPSPFIDLNYTFHEDSTFHAPVLRRHKEKLPTCIHGLALPQYL